MNFLLWAPESCETGQALLDWLKANGATIEGGKEPGDTSIDHLIRWGSQKALAKKAAGKVFNSKSAVALASNKLKALEVMVAHDVHTVPVRTKTSDIVTYPVLGRHDKHSHGSDIVLCLSPHDVEVSIQLGCTHWTDFIPPKDEYRVHVFDGTVIKTSVKVLEDPKNFVPYCRNFETGWVFKHPQHVPMQVKLMAVEAVAALGLTFGAVDVLWSGHTAFVLEVNTAPGLIETGVEVYGTRFLKEL